jgi:hypothetical protein
MDAHLPEPAAAEGLLERLEHRLFKKPLWTYLRGVHPLVIPTSPVIYLCAIPFLALDLAVTIYQAICFPVYGIAKVPRRDYLVFDRGRLAYLNAIEEIGCVYCSYANGLLAYIVEIAARTELHFCPSNMPTRRFGHTRAIRPLFPTGIRGLIANWWITLPLRRRPGLLRRVRAAYSCFAAARLELPSPVPPPPVLG